MDGGLPDEVRALVDGRNFAHVATVGEDGSPHVVAVWIGREGDRVHFFTQAGSQKARHLDRDPRVAVSIVDHENPYRGANVRGRVVERRTGEEALAAMDLISERFTGAPFPMRGPNGVLFVIEPEKVGYRELPFSHRPA